MEEISGPSEAALSSERPIETAPLIAVADDGPGVDTDPLLAPGAPMNPGALDAVLGGTVVVIVVMNEVTSVRFRRRTPACASWPASIARMRGLECMIAKDK